MSNLKGRHCKALRGIILFSLLLRLFPLVFQLVLSRFIQSTTVLASSHAQKRLTANPNQVTILAECQSSSSDDFVDILVYDISLTGPLRQTTILILQEKLPNVAQETTQRKTRSMSHNHVSIGLELVKTMH